MTPISFLTQKGVMDGDYESMIIHHNCNRVVSSFLLIKYCYPYPPSFYEMIILE